MLSCEIFLKRELKGLDMIFKSPLKSNSTKIMLLGSGELGKEVAIEAQRLGLEIVAVDRYENAPAHLVAHKSYTIDMKNREQLLEVIEREKPDFILPEIEAINIDALLEVEERGFEVIPNAKAVHKTMNRKNIREFANKDLGIPTSRYQFIKSFEDLVKASKEIGFPVVIKPVMSSSGHGQSIAKSEADLENSWELAKEARGDSSELIVEEFIKFDYEITLLTVRNGEETVFCEPIGHIQKDGDYIFSWQPMEMSEKAKERSEDVAKKITDGLGGRGLFGVELFIKGDEVYFSEVSPRPHDTGMVTMITQSQSEFALHIRAVLGLPLDYIFYGSGVSAAFKSERDTFSPEIDVPIELFSKNSFFRVFGKPESHKGRRMGLLLIFDEVKNGLEKAKELISRVK
jgi:phosphoribosylglycinamide formyltransferase 2